MSWSQAVRFAALACSVVTLSGCATMRIKTYVPAGAELRGYRTFDWAAPDMRPVGDPRLDNNTLLLKRLTSDVELQLRAKGLEKAADGRPDLHVHYHVSVNQEIDLNGSDRQSGDCDDCKPHVFEAGTLVLDLVDARTNALVWRGWATETVDGAIDDQKRMEQKIDEAVARVMERLPRRPQ